MIVRGKAMRAEGILVGIGGLALLLTIVVCNPSSAGATGKYEPNDEIAAATGPIGSQPYSAEFETEQDEDWYWVPLAGQQQVDVAVRFSEFHCSYGGTANFINPLDETLGTLDAIGQDFGDELEDGEEVLHYRYTTPPAAGVYFLRFSGAGPPCGYEFQVGPESVFAPGLTNPVVHLGEPDNFKNSAHGPISADVLYAGTIEEEGDVDQVYMEARPHTKIGMTMTGYCEQGEVAAKITIPGEGTREGELETGEGQSYGPDEFETGDGGRIYVAISGNPGCHWVFRVTPSSALSPPPEPVDPCAGAEQLLRERKRGLRRLDGKLHRARSRRARGHLHHQIEAKRQSVRAAKHLVATRCGA